MTAETDKNALDRSVVAAIAKALPPLPESGKVALLGGSFNPPHLAHALLGVAVLSAEPYDALWVLPCADHPFGKALAPFEARLAMCERAFASVANVAVVDVEQRLPAPNYTVQTLRYLRAAAPDLTPAFVVGTDILDELDRWREPDALRELCDFIVIPRAGYRREGRLEIVLPEVSSTEVRRRLAETEDASGLMADAVLDYIGAHGLYRDLPSP